MDGGKAVGFFVWLGLGFFGLVISLRIFALFEEMPRGVTLCGSLGHPRPRQVGAGVGGCPLPRSGEVGQGWGSSASGVGGIAFREPIWH